MTDAQKRLVEENHNLIYTFLQKYHLDIEEDYDLAAIGLCKAAIKFNPDVAKFSTYAFRCMFTTVFSEKRKKRISDDLLLYYQAEQNNDTELTFENLLVANDNTETAAIMNDAIEKCGKNISEKNYKIITMVINGYTQKEIAKEMHCSQPQISRIKNNFKKMIS